MKKFNYYEGLIWAFIMALMITIALPARGQVSPCDSISYTITSSANTNILQLDGVITGVCPVNFPCVVQDWSWQVCDDALCFGDNGQTVYFQQFNAYDTLKVCLTTIINYMGATYSCISQCDSLVFGTNGWMKMGMGTGTGTSISEMQAIVDYEFEDNRMFDVLGREFETYQDIPYGTIYIRNRQKCIKR